MTRPIPGQPDRDPPVERRDEADDLLSVAGQRMPAWLSSMAWHLSLLIMLALVSAGGQGLGHGFGVSVDFRDGGSSGRDGSDMAQGSELALPPPIAPSIAEEPNPLAFQPPDVAAAFAQDLQLDQLAELSPFRDLSPDRTPRFGNGTGVGRGRGDGVGDDDEVPGSSGFGLNPTRTRIFNVEAEGTRFVYVFDHSQSMSSTIATSYGSSVVYSVTALDAALAELKRSLGDLDKLQQFQIIFYNHDYTVFEMPGSSRKLFPANAENKRRATEFVQQIRAEGHTRHVAPLEAAIRMRPDVIFLLTDGESKDDPTPSQLTQLKTLNKGRSQINVIQFYLSTRHTGALAKLAEQNRGKHMFFDIATLGPANDPRRMQAPSPDSLVP